MYSVFGKNASINEDLVEMRGRLCKTADGGVGWMDESSVPVCRGWRGGKVVDGTEDSGEVVAPSAGFRADCLFRQVGREVLSRPLWSREFFTLCRYLGLDSEKNPKLNFTIDLKIQRLFKDRSGAKALIHQLNTMQKAFSRNSRKCSGSDKTSPL